MLPEVIQLDLLMRIFLLQRCVSTMVDTTRKVSSGMMAVTRCVYAMMETQTTTGVLTGKLPQSLSFLPCFLVCVGVFF